MQVVNKIDYLIAELTKLRPTLSDDPSSNEKRFSDLLTSSLENSHTIAGKETEVMFSKSAKPENEIPSWVDPDYGYDPNNPRKPNMRELMEAMSGKNVEDLYKEPKYPILSFFLFILYLKFSLIDEPLGKTIILLDLIE